MAVKITIEGDGLKYETSTSILKASQVIAFLNTGEQAPNDSPSVSSGNVSLTLLNKGTKSPRDYIIDYSAKTNPQKILAFAKYYIDQFQVEVFEMSVIRGYFKKSGEVEPKNFSRDLNESIKLRYIYETEEVGKYSITAHGNDLLSSAFEGEVKQLSRPKTPLSKKISNGLLSEGIQELEIIPKIEGIIDYHDISTKSERILWILFFAQQNSIMELSSVDIAYFADKLLDKIPTKNISGLTEYTLKKAYLTKNSSGKFKLLHDGITHLKSLQKNK